MQTVGVKARRDETHYPKTLKLLLKCRCVLVRVVLVLVLVFAVFGESLFAVS